MSNWFESNPTRTVLVHTLVVAGAVWAMFAFVFDENKVSVHKAQAEAYKAKTEVLEAELGKLREENKRYLDWLMSAPTSFPLLESRLQNAQTEIAKLESKVTALESSGVQASGSMTSAPYVTADTLSIREKFLDARTSASAILVKVYSDKTADLTLTLPGAGPLVYQRAKEGTSWSFRFDKGSYFLTLQRVDWYSNKVSITVFEAQAAK